MKLKVIKQRDSIACGPTCIKMACNFFGLDISASQIAALTKYRKREGLTNTQLVTALSGLGFKVREKSGAAWSDLKKYNTKNSVVIVSWMYKGYIGHFSILDGVTKTHIKLADPEIGTIRQMPKMAFMRLWHDYDDLWFPAKNTDIQLRWLAVVSK